MGPWAFSPSISSYIHTHVYIHSRLSSDDVSRALLIDYSLHWELHEKAFICLIPTRLAAWCHCIYIYTLFGFPSQHIHTYILFLTILINIYGDTWETIGCARFYIPSHHVWLHSRSSSCDTNTIADQVVLIEKHVDLEIHIPYLDSTDLVIYKNTHSVEDRYTVSAVKYDGSQRCRKSELFM